MELGEEFGEVVQSLSAMPAVLGIALTGSQAREGMATKHSDTDFIVFVEDGFAGMLMAPPGVDVAVYRESAAATPRLADEDFDEWYNRGAFLHARPLFEQAPGSVSRWILSQCTLTPPDAEKVSTFHLDGYLNLAIRALKSERDGRPLAAMLDSTEAVGWALTTIFAFEHRIRPFNKYLEWELLHYPLDASTLSTDILLPVVSAILSGDVGAHRTLFALIAPIATSAGLKEALASWGADLAIIAQGV